MVKEGTVKSLMLVLGILLEVISIINYNQYLIPAVIGMFLGLFLIAKALI